MKTVEIFFDNLPTEAQRHLLDIFDTTAKEENWDVFPIAVMERYTEDKVADA